MHSTVGKADEAKERALRSSAGSSSGGERKSHEHSCIATSALCTNRASLTVREELEKRLRSIYCAQETMIFMYWHEK